MPDIVAIILDAANGGATKTRLATKANLTSIQLRQYTELLIERKLLTEIIIEGNSKHLIYRTTEKGLRYLEVYSSLKNIITFPLQANGNNTSAT